MGKKSDRLLIGEDENIDASTPRRNGMTPAKSAWLRRKTTGLVELLFPSTCLACHGELSTEPNGIDLCESCRQELARSTWPVCRKCAKRAPDLLGEAEDCPYCRQNKLRFDRALAWGEYDGLLGELLVEMKQDRSERLARMFGRLLISDMGEQLAEEKFNAVAAVPMHPWRRFRRGTNPPAILAKIVARELGVPFFPRLLKRRNHFTQKGLTRAARFRYMQNEMRLRAGYHLESFHVLLIDDILTTGATCSEATRVLKRAGVAGVTVLVVGRTPIHY